MVAILSPVLAEKLLHGGSSKETTVRAARFQKQTLDRIKLRARQPATPRRGKS
jgi:hypothetical protein